MILVSAVFAVTTTERLKTAIVLVRLKMLSVILGEYAAIIVIRLKIVISTATYAPKITVAMMMLFLEMLKTSAVKLQLNSPAVKSATC